MFDQLIDDWMPRKRPPLDIRQYHEHDKDSVDTSVRCARCFSLQHNGRVKSQTAEAVLPPFDFEKQVGRKIALTKFRKQLLVVVVDVADFDGSFPTQTLKTILDSQASRSASEGPAASGSSDLSFIVVANKADLLPASIQKQHTEQWVRQRIAAAGLPRPAVVAVVSSFRGWGVAPLLARLQRGVGTRGDVWVVGTQNAGKSSLVNAMRGVAGLPGRRDVTATHVPGTTLGALNVPGLLPSGCKMMDTPGIVQGSSLARYLTPDELKVLQPRRPIKGRTYRLGAGRSILLGGLARIDVVGQEKGETLYLTPCVSDELGCHLGKTEGVEERRAKHLGGRLSPPSAATARSFPALVPTLVEVSGDNWKRSSRDIAIAGLGWVGVGVDGSASLRVWTPPGVKVSVRPAMARSLAKDLERPGFGSSMGEAAAAVKNAQRKVSVGASGKRAAKGKDGE